MQELRLIMRHLDVSSADMEKGHLRCDANISLRPVGQNQLFPKTEIKNLNSFRAVERALEYEIKRQTKLWEAYQAPDTLATRGWNEAKQITEEQRTKEEAQDYRYFPEPDLPPMTFTPEYIEEMRTKIPELPQAKRARFVDMYGIAPADAKIIVEDKDLANYTEQVISELKDWLNSLEGMEGTEEEIWENNKQKLIKLVTGWLINKLGALLNENNIKIQDCKITPENFAELITMIYQNKLNSATAQTLLAKMFQTGIDPSYAIEEGDLKQISDEKEIENIIDKIIAANPDPVTDYKKGKVQVIKFLVGQVMRETKGRTSPQLAEEIIKSKLSE